MITTSITTEGTGQTVPPAGPQGPSAYDVAVQNGFVGTQSQWLASLEGPAADPTSLNAAVSRATLQATNAAGYAATASSAATSALVTLGNIASQISAAATSVVSSIMTALQTAVATAAGSATAAAQSATAAAGSATTAGTGATTATNQATAAAGSATAAAGSSTSATGSALSASGSATAAAGSATTAQNWAMQTSGTVDGTNYSAKYWAQLAQTAAAQAAAGGVAPFGAFTVGNIVAANNTSGTTAKDSGLSATLGAAPLMDGTASPGAASTLARSDHVHPTDKTRLASASALSELAALGVLAQALARQNIGAVSRGRAVAYALTN